jgi:hypothetical protein
MASHVKEISSYPSNADFNQVLSQSGSYVFDSVNLGTVTYVEGDSGNILFKIDENTLKELIPIDTSSENKPLEFDHDLYRLTYGTKDVTGDFVIYSRNNETFVELRTGRSFVTDSKIKLTVGYSFDRSIPLVDTNVEDNNDPDVLQLFTDRNIR